MSRTRPRLFAAAAGTAAALLLTACGGSGTAAGGPWKPSKPIEYVAPANTGGGWDTLARSTARILEEDDLVDRPMRVVNKPGAGGAIGWAYVANHAKDPHKLFVTSPPILLVPMAGESDHSHRDFTPIARLMSEPLAYVVKNNSPIKDFGDLADRLKADPKKVSVAGGSGPGSLDHVGLAGAVQAAGADPSKVKYVPFDGGGEAITGLLGGHVDVAVAGASEAQGLSKSGDVRVLAVSSGERVKTLPDAPTLVESGVDYEFDVWRGVMGPAGLTDEQVAYYEKAFAEMVKQDSWKKERDRFGWTDAWMNSGEFGEFLNDQEKELGEILSSVGLKKK
ncbi:Bug family tripartite tricarboxylate transporter substrate binding protein [Streptomyces zingiberis]|uniref:Tripartite tricarboxylate transporter substrate binding protein n=1 Tax=Streptomyces zingiberis TaxID=2053010 RepID=A0ABX1BZH7_9ACTN|nr:tripartite tricarboxylate transporter substrate binding protein [Streptomyces zingiberis]NJQ00729.1 tripartite tricarboxylate transporter substrate binding protein [Streptomyces zingiberis]